MRKPAKDRTQILRELTEVFRAHGYNGTTLSKLTQGTGLERASLYHYFPGGKRAMAEAVLKSVVEQLGANVIGALEGEAPAPARLEAMLQATSDFYNGGEELCFVSIFAIGEDSEHLASTLREAVSGWVDALTRTLADAGHDDAAGLANASLACIQGALVLAGVTHDAKPFRDALAFLRSAWGIATAS